MTDKTFAELFCARHSIPPQQYERVVLERCLYPHARLLAPVIRWIWPDHFIADVDFVRSVARLRRYREFSYEAEEFSHHPANRGFWRRTANLRASSRALRRMVRATLHPEAEDAAEQVPNTAVPFAGAAGEGGEGAKRLDAAGGASAWVRPR